jgi:hypothetical protein
MRVELSNPFSTQVLMWHLLLYYVKALVPDHLPLDGDAGHVLGGFNEREASGIKAYIRRKPTPW